MKMVTGKPFGISKIGGKDNVDNHSGAATRVTRNLSEPSDQTIMHIDVYAD